VPSSGWAHVVVTWAAPYFYLYLNGQLVGANIGISGGLGIGNSNFAAGYNPIYSGDYVNGSMAWVAVYPSALSPARVLAHYLAAGVITPSSRSTGRVSWNSGSLTPFVSLPGPPVYPLQGPVQAKLPLPHEGNGFPPRGKVGSNPGGLPSVLLLNSFEGGAAGTSVTTGNSGGSSGSAFDTVNTGTGASITYDLAESDAAGFLSGKIVTGGSAANSYVGWGKQLGLQSLVWFRVYAYFTAFSGGNDRLVRILTPSGTFFGAIQVNNAGKVVTLDSSATSHTVSSLTLPLNQWFRLEGYFLGSPNAGQIQVKIFVSYPYGTVPDETDTTGVISTGGTFGQVTFGNPASVTNDTFWIDNLGVSNTGYLGPVLPRLYGALVAPARARIPWNAPRGRVYTSTSSPAVPLTLRSLVFNLGIPYLQWETGSVKTQWTVP
jgi:Concanavalin A-like lectin/glucanases superfamily